MKTTISHSLAIAVALALVAASSPARAADPQPTPKKESVDLPGMMDGQKSGVDRVERAAQAQGVEAPKETQPVSEGSLSAETPVAEPSPQAPGGNTSGALQSGSTPKAGH
jgi:hypothetical protein